MKVILLNAWFLEVIAFLSYASLFMMAAEFYLTLNKLWKRKHEKLVAESISLSAKFISLLPITVFTISFYMDDKIPAFVGNAMLIFYILVQIMIGAGLWTNEKKNKSLWTLILQSLRLESKEAGNLAKSIFAPSQADKIIDILGLIASIDQHIDEKEMKFINEFADCWDIKIDWEKYRRKITAESKPDYLHIHQTVQEYLQTSPDVEQAQQLLDVISILVHIDNNLSAQESLMLDELTGLIRNYTQDSPQTLFNVAIVPQNDQQEESIKTIFPDLKKGKIAGGYAYILGPFYSKNYAEVICEKYRNFNFFSVAVLAD